MSEAGEVGSFVGDKSFNRVQGFVDENPFEYQVL